MPDSELLVRPSLFPRGLNSAGKRWFALLLVKRQLRTLDCEGKAVLDGCI